MAPSRRIGFISTRFAGTDGVSLETSKWATVLERLGHDCFYFSGQCDRPTEKSYVVEEAFYRHPAIEDINKTVYQSTWGSLHEGRLRHPEIEELHEDFFSVYIRPAHITQRIHELRFYIKEKLYKFVHQFKIELLIVENASTIPLNIPLGLAITEFIAETGYPVIAHHHDFHWERQRFMNNSVRDYLASAFPPNLPSIRHVVINSIQEHQLASRIGAAAMVIPNVMDFDSPPPPLDEYTSTVRSDLGLAPEQYLILQPTRIIQRKGIEHAIELTRRLGLPAELVISHASGDEGTDIYTYNLASDCCLQRLTVGRFSDNLSPTFSPDGRRIAFISTRPGLPQIYVMATDGTGQELFAPFDYGMTGSSNAPEWSPDGLSVAFHRDVAGSPQVFVMDVASRRVRQLTSAGRNEDPTWAPDGRHLAFVSDRTGSRQIWVIDLDTGRVRQVTRIGEARLPAWSQRIRP